MRKISIILLVVLILFLYIKDNCLADEIKVFGIDLTLLVVSLYLVFYLISYIVLLKKNTKLKRRLRETEISERIASDHVAEEGEKDY